MPLSITIAGIDRTAACRFESITIKNTIVSKADTAEIAVFVRGAGWRPKAANELIITTSTDAIRHFAGMITDLNEEDVNGTDLRYRLTCKDYSYLLDRLMIAKNYDPQAASAIVTDIISSYSTGFSSTGVQAAPSVAAQRYDYVYPTDAIKQLADQLQWIWWVDYNKVVHFTAAGSDPAPIALLNLDSSTAYGNLVFSEAASQIKNRVLVDGYKKKSSVAYQRIFTGDGNSRFFALGYEPSSISSSEFNATLNAQALTAKTDNIDGSPSTSNGSTGNLFVCYPNMGIRMDYAPSSTEILTATFNYMLDGGFQSDDPAAQTEMAAREGGDGVHMGRISDPGLTNLASDDSLAIAVGQKTTTRYGQPRLIAAFESFTQGWRAGQALPITTVRRMGGFTKQFYVQEVTKRLVNHPGPAGTPLWRHELSVSESVLPV